MNQEHSNQSLFSKLKKGMSKRNWLVMYIVVIHLTLIVLVLAMFTRVGWIDANQAQKIGYGFAYRDCRDAQTDGSKGDCDSLKFTKAERLYVNLPIPNEDRSTWFLTYRTQHDTYFVNLTAKGDRVSVPK